MEEQSGDEDEHDETSSMSSLSSDEALTRITDAFKEWKDGEGTDSDAERAGPLAMPESDEEMEDDDEEEEGAEEDEEENDEDEEE